MEREREVAHSRNRQIDGERENERNIRGTQKRERKIDEEREREGVRERNRQTDRQTYIGSKDERGRKIRIRETKRRHIVTEED